MESFPDSNGIKWLTVAGLKIILGKKGNSPTRLRPIAEIKHIDNDAFLTFSDD